MNISSAMSAAR